ncbi:MAG: STAS domain-containing protein [Acidobacteriota bacterium]|nr:MAG: STAS domain-containing protein [Acidobacteriota bacterium]
MKIIVEQTGTVTILRPQGDIRVGEGDVALRGTLKEQLEQGKNRIVLDLAAVRFLDSAGLGELVASLKRVREAQGDMKIANVNQRVSDALHVTQLVRVLDIYKDVSEAIAAFV